mgnify:CR=1 FL=1
MRKRILSILLAIMGIALAVFLILACGSYASGDASFNTASNGVYSNLMRAPGAYTADLLWQGFGFIALLFPVALIAWSILTVFNLCAWVKLRIYLFIPAVLLGCWLLADVALDDPAFAKAGAGGYIGHFLATFGTLNAWYWLALAWALFAGLVIFSFKLPAMRMAVWAGRAVTSKLGRVSMPHPRFSWFSFKRKTANEHDATDFADAPVSDEPTRHVAVKMRKKAEPKPRKEPQLDSFKPDKSAFVLPSAALLAPAKAGGPTISADMMARISKDLENVLSQFGVNGKIVGANPGPVVTLYEFEPASGVKTARVISLADDIAREMRAVSVRIAVVPGSNTIGIEMPNVKRDTVYIRELVENAKFKDNPGALALILGKDIGGTPVYADLAKMPHLLVAGTTGSGKSVAINTMILSLLYRLTPAQCRMIMVDPKMLELSVYNGIPHLLTPVVTDPGKAVMALKWAVREMEDRYRAMSQLGVRNIDGFNQKLLQAARTGQTLSRRVQTGFDPDTGKPIFEEQAFDLTPIPYIVVIVDEMADLMLVAGKEVEAAIQRLAQMARAAGIHLIMATQRPSVDVITGTIKANFPTRMSFQVTSKIDSRTILGEQGAEQLLGKGDMLYMPAGLRPQRIHAGFVEDAEVEAVVEFLKSQRQPEYVEGITEGELEMKGKDAGALFDRTAMGGASNGKDDLYEQAVAIVRNDKKASTSYIQRRLGIGYNKAASLIERMEDEGVITPADHVGRREVI